MGNYKYFMKLQPSGYHVWATIIWICI